MIEPTSNCLRIRSGVVRIVAALAISVAAAGVAAPSASAASDCSTTNPALEAGTPGTPQFTALVAKELTEGCVAYVNDSTTLYVDVIRGPDVAEYQVIGPTGTELVDIALAPNGIMYGAGSNHVFYTVNRETGAATAVGAGIGYFVNGLTVSPAGVVYGSGDSNLLTIDPVTGKGTATAQETGFNSSGDLAFSSAGDLYMSSAPGDKLVKLSPASGAGAEVGQIGKADVYGLGRAWARSSGSPSAACC